MTVSKHDSINRQTLGGMIAALKEESFESIATLKFYFEVPFWRKNEIKYILDEIANTLDLDISVKWANGIFRHRAYVEITDATVKTIFILLETIRDVVGVE